MKVKLVTTYPPTNCGMAEHSKYLVGALKNTEINPEIVDIKNPDSANPFYFIGLAQEAIKNTTKEDVIHIEFHLSLFGKLLVFPGFYITIFLIWLKLFSRAKIVITMHDSLIKGDAKKLGVKGLIFYYYYQMLAPFLKYFSDKMIFHSEFGKKMAVKGWNFNSNKIEVIPLGSPMNIRKLDKKMCKKKLGYSNKKILIILGFIKEARDYNMVIEALKKLDKNVVLLVAGDIQLEKHKIIRDNILKKIKELGLKGRVKLLGYVEEKDMPLLLSATDIGIIPYSRSFGDFTSATMAIQLAYDIPVLATNLATFENFKKNTECIETYDKNDVDNLVEKIDDLLYEESEIKQLKKNAQKYWKETNWDSVGKKTKDFYSSLFKKLKEKQ